MDGMVLRWWKWRRRKPSTKCVQITFARSSCSVSSWFSRFEMICNVFMDASCMLSLRKHFLLTTFTWYDKSLRSRIHPLDKCTIIHEIHDSRLICWEEWSQTVAKVEWNESTPPIGGVILKADVINRCQAQYEIVKGDGKSDSLSILLVLSPSSIVVKARSIILASCVENEKWKRRWENYMIFLCVISLL